MSTFLPFLDPRPDRRNRQLMRARRRYRFRHDSYVSPLAVAHHVPLRELFAWKWLKVATQRAFTLLGNRVSKHRFRYHRFAAEVDRGFLGIPRLAAYLRHALRDATEDRPGSLDDYADLFRRIGLPPIHRDFYDDRAFARMRLAGPNPLMIKQISEVPDHFPVTDKHYGQAIPGDSLDAACNEGRLFLVDYHLLEKAEDKEWDGVRMYLYAPLALFAVDPDNKELRPVAIQCEQTPGDENPVLTPGDGHAWTMAKTIVEMADGNYHEAVSHLGRTHLFVEPFVLSTHRQLSPRHPVFRLLTPHFQGTIAINYTAVQMLVVPGLVVDQVMAPKIESIWELTAEGAQSFLCDDVSLPQTFARRGVADTETLPSYPYRDDSLLYWSAIRRWVAGYLSTYYSSDSQVAQDAELQAWYQELKAQDGGRVKGLRGDPGSSDYLVEICTLVIFTASVQHAAVNFPQYDLMSYVPNMPGACYQPAPKSATGYSEQDYLDLLPPLKTAELQTEFLYFLGSTHYTQLGQYRRRDFRDPRIGPALTNFHKNIDEIGAEIAQRNLNRPAYRFLEPAGVPQSINV